MQTTFVGSHTSADYGALPLLHIVLLGGSELASQRIKVRWNGPFLDVERFVAHKRINAPCVACNAMKVPYNSAVQGLPLLGVHWKICISLNVLSTYLQRSNCQAKASLRGEPSSLAIISWKEEEKEENFLKLHINAREMTLNSIFCSFTKISSLVSQNFLS